MSASTAQRAPIAPLPWDSAFFGVPIARVTASRLDEAALAAALEACERDGVRCAYLLLDADDARGAALAQAAGFVLRDVRVELDRPVTAADGDDAAWSGATAVPIGRVREDRAGALAALARRAFAGTRFLADPGFPRERCAELYAAFLRRAIDGAPARLALATADAGGFIACQLDRERGVGTIELVAVADGSRGQGVGRALVGAALATFARAGLVRAEVVTQAANVASQRCYQRAGFRTARAGLWLHRWFDGPGAGSSW
jgi:ribosomal protein S18 acetylase RimI-like enzyme